MIYVLGGALGAVLVLLLFAAGVYVGVKIERHQATMAQPEVKVETPAEAERKRLIAEQKAFSTLMNYNADMAYGHIPAQDAGGISKDGEI